MEQLIARFNRLQGRDVTGINNEALSLLMAYDWPGNVRELENAIEHAFILCSSGRVGLAHLPETLTGATRVVCRWRSRAARDTLDAQAISAALERTGGNRAAAARELGIHTSTLFRKMRALNIQPPERDGRSRRKTR